MPKRCKNARLWPDMRARVEGASECTPPFTEDLYRSSYAFFVVSVPNIAFVDWFEETWQKRPDNAVWEMVLALNPNYGTRDLGAILERLFVLQSEDGSHLKVRLLTQGKLENAEPRLSIVILQPEGEQMSVSVGSSHSLGLGIHGAGDINLWAALDSSQVNSMRQLAKAYWITAASLTKPRCEIPLLRPCKGDEEGYIQWQAYEALLNDKGTPIGEDGRTIGGLPLKEDGVLDEDAIEKTNDDSSALDEQVLKIPPVVGDMQELYQKGSLVSVSQGIKPLTIPIPPSLFGQTREEHVGAIKHTQTFSIQLFADDAMARKIEKFRKGVTELVKLFCFSFGKGKYWVPNCAREALGKAIDLVAKESGEALSQALGGDLDKFLSSRKEAIKVDCENIYRRFYPSGSMSGEVVDHVLEKLKARAKGAEENGFAPKITQTSITFRYSNDSREDPWNDALVLLTDIVRKPREMVANTRNRGVLNSIKISVTEYLESMDVLNDRFISNVKERGDGTRAVKARALTELDRLDSITEGDMSGDKKCQALLSLLHNLERT